MIPTYEGKRAKEYEAKRVKQPEWHKENEVVELFLSLLPKGGTVLDIPCGTGRFHGLYERLGIKATGVDVSNDMLEIARSKGMYCAKGSILHLKVAQYDASVCMRLANWLTPTELQRALENLKAASRQIIIGIQLSEKHMEVGGAKTHVYEGWNYTLSRLGLEVTGHHAITRSTNYTYSIFRLEW